MAQGALGLAALPLRPRQAVENDLALYNDGWEAKNRTLVGEVFTFIFSGGLFRHLGVDISLDRLLRTIYYCLSVQIT